MRFETGISASSSAKEEDIEDHKSKKGGKAYFLLGGCLHLVVLLDIMAGLWFHNFLSLCSRLQFP